MRWGHRLAVSVADFSIVTSHSDFRRTAGRVSPGVSSLVPDADVSLRGLRMCHSEVVLVDGCCVCATTSAL